MDASEHTRNGQFHKGPQFSQIIRESILNIYFFSVSITNYVIKFLYYLNAHIFVTTDFWAYVYWTFSTPIEFKLSPEA
jgi:hypothetical protein